MTDPESISSIGHAIQLSVAPVFLLAGVGALLNVLTNRLTRAVDRYRKLTTDADEATLQAKAREINTQITRSRLIHWAIVFCTVCALMICLVVALMFVGTYVTHDPSQLIAVLFIAGMCSLVIALLLFLREVSLALQIMKSFSRIRGK